MTRHVHDPDARLPEVKRAVTGIGYKLDRLDAPSVDTEGDSDALPKNLSNITPAYKRAIWTVVALNVGYGLIEMFGGFLSGWPALKADALDFLGDGFIPFLALPPVGLALISVPRCALIQDVFLGV